MLQDVVQHAAIPCFQRRERGLEPLPRLFQKRWHRRFSDGQVQRRHHRRQRKRHEERQQHGERDRQAKFLEILAVDARHHADGQKDRRDRKRRRHDGQHDFLRAIERRRFCIFPHLAMADDVLDDDDGIVDEQADGERQAEEAHRVDAEMAEVHERERRCDRCRDRERADNGAVPVAEEPEHDDDGKEAAENQVFPDIVHGLRDARSIVAHEVDGDAGRQLVLQAIECLLDVGRDAYGVAARLLADLDADGGRAVIAAERRRFFDRIFRHADLLEEDRLCAARRELGAIDVIQAAERACRADRRLPAAVVEIARWNVLIHGFEAGSDVADGEAVLVELVLRQQELDFALRIAADLNLADARDFLQLRLQRIVHECAELAEVAVFRRQRDGRDGRGIHVKAGDDGLFHAVRQIAAHGADLVAHILRGLGGVDADLELDADVGTALRRRRRDVAHAFRFGDGFLDLAHDLLVDLLRLCAVVRDADGDERIARVRHFVDIHFLVAHDA